MQKRYATSLEEKRVEFDGDNNVEYMWVKRALAEGASEVCGSVRVGGKNPKSVWWNDEIKAAVRERRQLGRECWQLAIKIQKKHVWKRTERRREKLKGV